MWDRPVHNPPPCLPRSSSHRLAASPLHQLPVSTPPPSLDEYFFFNFLVVGLPYSSIFCQFWLFFVFKFVVVLLLVVQGGTVCLPTLPFGQKSQIFKNILIQQVFIDHPQHGRFCFTIIGAADINVNMRYLSSWSLHSRKETMHKTNNSYIYNNVSS